MAGKRLGRFCLGGGQPSTAEIHNTSQKSCPSSLHSIVAKLLTSAARSSGFKSSQCPARWLYQGGITLWTAPGGAGWGGVRGGVWGWGGGRGRKQAFGLNAAWFGVQSAPNGSMLCSQPMASFSGASKTTEAAQHSTAQHANHGGLLHGRVASLLSEAKLCEKRFARCHSEPNLSPIGKAEAHVAGPRCASKLSTATRTMTSKISIAEPEPQTPSIVMPPPSQMSRGRCLETSDLSPRLLCGVLLRGSVGDAETFQNPRGCRRVTGRAAKRTCGKGFPPASATNVERRVAPCANTGRTNETETDRDRMAHLARYACRKTRHTIKYVTGKGCVVPEN
jgi:hypothetical protein